MQCYEQDHTIAPLLPSANASAHQSTKVLPSRVQADLADAALLRNLDDPSWNEDVHDARELLKGLTIRRAGTPINRLYVAMIESDAVIYCATLASTGAVAVCASAILNLPLVPVAVASAGMMALAINLIQRIERTI